MVVNFQQLYNRLLNTYNSFKDITTKLKDIFINPTPQDVPVKIIDENGNPTTVNIPNLSKWMETFSKNLILSGSRFEYKNIIINGDFQIWQRGENVTTSDDSGYLAPDRFFFWLNGTNTVANNTLRRTIKKQYDPKLGYYCHIDFTKLKNDATINSGISQRTEPEMFRHILEAYNNDNTTKITISFYLRTNKPVIRKYIHISGYDSNGNNINGNLELGCEKVTPNQWNKVVTTVSVADIVNFASTLGISNPTLYTSYKFIEFFGIGIDQKCGQQVESGDYLDVTQIQVELGKYATTFERIPYDIQLSRCMRYYEVIENAVAWKASYSDDTYGYAVFKVRKRALPTIKFIRPSDGLPGADYYWWNGSSLTLNHKLDGLGSYHLTTDGLGFGYWAYTPKSTNDAHLVTNIHADAEIY